jgi:signal transduction histidine kinase
VLLYLVLFAVVPSSFLMLGGATLLRSALPLLSGGSAWDSVATTGRRAIEAARHASLTPAERSAVDAHEQELASSLTQSKRVSYLASRATVLALVAALVGSLLVALLASRVAGHLSRQLSRPLKELVGWTELIARGRPLPDAATGRGAPEFETLRRRMRKMSAELEAARASEREAERLQAFRETARRVAHELKNPLTPIRLAVERLKRDPEPALAEVIEVLSVESQRLEDMARSFSQFGKLPEGPRAGIDLGEMARYTSRAIVPSDLPLTVRVEEGLPMISGHHDSLARALSNVLLNAVDACASRPGGAVTVSVQRATLDGNGNAAVAVSVRDTGSGIAPDRLATIWDPYVTHKPGGTGLGLAIARQTVLAHHGIVTATSREGEGTEIRFVLPVDGRPDGADTPEG